MEILSSGSFINLDHKEKIEQLVFTAQEIAETAAKTEGFEASEENNKKLALDIWQGAEYMCREAEEVQIKNIFISNFLERMNEISGVSKPIDNSADTTVSKQKTIPANANSNDEYLGVVQTDEIQEQGSSGSEFEKDEPNKTPEIKAEKIDTASGQSETSQKTDSKTEQGSSITSPEKEPYRFDECTVTTTIQLFPTRTDTRKVVLSVRTHDFAPQISVHEIRGEATPEQLIPALGEALEKYKTDLPVKVIDKLRQEKESGKNKKRKSSTRTTSGENPQEVSSQTEQSAVAVPRPESNTQGSLFSS